VAARNQVRRLPGSIHLNQGKKKVYTRNGLDWTKRFSLIAGALDMPGQAIIDGEVVVVHEGRTNIQSQNTRTKSVLFQLPCQDEECVEGCAWRPDLEPGELIR
jgi:hypothetical protein